MANKFQKSVLERLEQEAVRKKQKANDSGKEPITAVNHVKPEPTDVEVSKFQPVAQADQADNPIVTDMGFYLRREPLRFAKNKTFYLDVEVIEAVKTTAKKQAVTDSKLVNDILRRILGIGS